MLFLRLEIFDCFFAAQRYEHIPFFNQTLIFLYISIVSNVVPIYLSVIVITIEPWTVTKKHLKFGVQNDGKQKQMNKTSNKTLAKNDTNSESETVKKEV